MSEASTAAWVVELEEPRFAGVLGAFPHWLLMSPNRHKLLRQARPSVQPRDIYQRRLRPPGHVLMPPPAASLTAWSRARGRSCSWSGLLLRRRRLTAPSPVRKVDPEAGAGCRRRRRRRQGSGASLAAPATASRSVVARKLARRRPVIPPAGRGLAAAQGRLMDGRHPSQDWARSLPSCPLGRTQWQPPQHIRQSPETIPQARRALSERELAAHAPPLRDGATSAQPLAWTGASHQQPARIRRSHAGTSS